MQSEDFATMMAIMIMQIRREYGGHAMHYWKYSWDSGPISKWNISRNLNIYNVEMLQRASMS